MQLTAFNTASSIPDGKRRLHYLDIARALSIVLVVLNHYDLVLPFSPALKALSYFEWFRMPTFFIISGLLYNFPKKTKTSEFLKNKAINLLVPYFAWGILLESVDTIIYVSTEGATPYSENFFLFAGKLLAYKLAVLSYGGHLLKPPVMTTWYILTLLLTIALFTAIKLSFKKDSMIVLIAAVCGWLGILLSRSNTDLPWNLNVALVALVYFTMGYYSKDLIRQINQVPRLMIYLVPPSVLLATTFIKLHQKGFIHFKITMFTGDFSNYVLCLVIPPVFTFLVLCLSIVLARSAFSKPLCFIGRNTLPILYLHWAIGTTAVSILKGYNIYTSPLAWSFLGVSIPLLLSSYLNKTPLLAAMFLGKNSSRIFIKEDSATYTDIISEQAHVRTPPKKAVSRIPVEDKLSLENQTF